MQWITWSLFILGHPVETPNSNILVEHRRRPFNNQPWEGKPPFSFRSHPSLSLPIISLPLLHNTEFLKVTSPILSCTIKGCCKGFWTSSCHMDMWVYKENSWGMKVRHDGVGVSQGPAWPNEDGWHNWWCQARCHRMSKRIILGHDVVHCTIAL